MFSDPHPEIAMSQNPLPAGLELLLETYTQSLSDVSFPDVDAAILQRQVDALHQMHERARALEAELADLTRDLRAEEQAATVLFGRALDYAKVFAADKPELQATLSQVKLPKVPKAPKLDKAAGPKPKKAKVVRADKRKAPPAPPDDDKAGDERAAA